MDNVSEDTQSTNQTVIQAPEPGQPPEIKDVKKKKGRGRPKKNTVKCPKCGKFVVSAYLKKHIDTQHPEKPVDPGKGFPSEVINKIMPDKKEPEKDKKPKTEADNKIVRESEELRGHVESPKNDFILKLIIASGLILTVLFVVYRTIAVKMSKNAPMPDFTPSQSDPGYYVDVEGRVYSPGEYHHG